MNAAFPARTPRDDEVDVYGLSHVGKVRKENQDHFLIATLHRQVNVLYSNLDDTDHRVRGDAHRIAFVAMVADGVGGGVGGSEASATALEAAMQYVHESVTVYYGARGPEEEFRDLLQRAAMRAHEAVRAERERKDIRGTMATTLTVYFGVWPTYYLLQVGDSRYYVMRDGVLHQVTRDQTMAEDLVAQGAMTRDVAKRTPLAHVLSSAVGGDTTIPVVTKHDSHWDNVHLICSDGLTKHVSDERIAEVIGNMTSARQVCEQLLQDALDGGGSDNITIIVARTVPGERS
ncbi:MAG: serine/threonine-protein phosphatase [Gemmatimonadetes bacterium]|nr:serine/threonine-protein phosphatase [Gemmatimonadota bacterium]